jgi:hypothetical protein
MFSICTFCFRSKLGVERAKANHAVMEKFPFAVSDEALIKSGVLCSYGLGHDFGEMEEKPKQVHKKVDNNLCVHCGLHKRNPASATSECKHEYRSE